MKEITTDTHSVSDFGALMHDSNARLDSPVTIYRSIHPTPQKHTTLRALFADMVSDDVDKIAASRQMVECYQKHLLEQKKEAKKEYEEKKSQLTGFSIGEFSYRNDKKENCIQYVSCFVFDLDGCKSTEEAHLLKQKLTTLPYIFAAFPSPSGHGLRVFVWLSATYETHRVQYMQVLKSSFTSIMLAFFTPIYIGVICIFFKLKVPINL